ncbi:trypsin-like serine peptidase [Dysgonomonas termitidis]|uniref:Trypsin-like serine peptidase n=1 Tax=Dysgonomonas termitidis TaxID=1516126 RepID=A0ABV9KX91_9BACT
MKSNLSRKFLTGVIILASVVSVVAQDKQYTLNEDKSQVSLIVDSKQTKYTVADIQYNKRGTALLEAKLYTLGINMDTIGSWSGLSDKDKIWKLNISVPQAKGFFVRFDDLYLPEGAKLYVYNKNNTTDAVVYNHGDNPDGGAYSIENLKGDNVVLEYVAPGRVVETPRILLSDVGYKYTNGNGEHADFGESASCMINVNCPDAENWQYQKKGVVLLRMVKSSNTYLCSGTLINNTNNDKTPYLLTADHCFENMTVAQIQSNTSFIFEYEYPTCEMGTDAQPPKYKYHKGSEVMVLNPISGGSDGALLRLTGNIPDDWDVYFNGWDRENKASSSGAIIHHPEGDVKKISFYEKELATGTWNGSATNAHWVVTYAKGATQRGSSGSPVFNSSGLIIGTLTGGENISCDLSKPDLYGKMWYHWDQYADVNKHMSKYLDPTNKGVTKLAGLNNNDGIEKNIVLDNNDLSMILNATTEVTILDGNGDYTVSSSNSNIVSAELNSNKVIIKALNFGSATVNVTDKKNKTARITVSVVSTVKYAITGTKTLTVTLNKEDDSINRVRIINLNGDTVIDKKGLDAKEEPIDISILPRDTYIIQTITKNGTKKAEKITW